MAQLQMEQEKENREDARKQLDSDTKIPIQDVNIFIKNSELGTITDKEGYFSLFLNNHHSIFQYFPIKENY